MNACPTCGRPLPGKPRSTGPHSALNHLRGHCRQIASHLGLTMSEVYDTIKQELADWPEKMLEGPRGARFVKASEVDISSAVRSAAIEICHVWAAHIGLILREGWNE